MRNKIYIILSILLALPTWAQVSNAKYPVTICSKKNYETTKYLRVESVGIAKVDRFSNVLGYTDDVNELSDYHQSFACVNKQGEILALLYEASGYPSTAYDSNEILSWRLITCKMVNNLARKGEWLNPQQAGLGSGEHITLNYLHISDAIEDLAYRHKYRRYIDIYNIRHGNICKIQTSLQKEIQSYLEH